MASIFLCHASEDKPLVEPIQLALVSAGYDVFYDEQSLPPGGDYQARILAAINRCDVFIFIASPASTSEGKFTLTELKFARERWPTPINRVLPVAIGGVLPQDLPPYLRAVTVMTVRGNAAAEVRFAVEAMLNAEEGSKTRVNRIRTLLKKNLLIAALVVVGAIIVSIGQLTGALSNIITFFSRLSGEETDATSPAYSSKLISSAPCSGDGGAAAIRAFAISFSNPNALPGFIKENAALFAKDGNTTKCYLLLTTQLNSGVLTKTFEQLQPESTANFTCPPGSTCMPGAGEPIQDPAIEAMQFAKTLSSLSHTFTSIAEGDVSAYDESQIIANAQQIWVATQGDLELQASMRMALEHAIGQFIAGLIAGLPRELEQKAHE